MPTGSSESWRQRRSITSRVTICALSPEEQRIALEKRRHELSYRVLPADQWPLLSWWSAKSTIAITVCI